MFVSKFRIYSAYVGGGIVGSALVYSFASQGQDSFLHAEARKSLKDTHVVVVGGGYGGVAAAMKLKDHCNLTLIDSRNSFHHNMGAQRSSVEPGFAKKCFISYEPTFGKGFKQGAVNAIMAEEKKIQLVGGETVSYDYLIIATGTGGPFPCKLGMNVNEKEGLASYDDMSQLVKAAQKIVVIGGGAAGVELSGDIRDDYKTKDVTLIHPREILVNDKVNESFQKTVKDRLKYLGVKTILGERVSNMDELRAKNFKNVVVKTNKGKTFEADVAIPCTGLKVNHDAYKTSFADKVDKEGRLKVDKFLQVEGVKDVYAIGDCSNVPELKVATGAQTHGEHVAANIQLLANGKEAKPYTINEKISMCLSIGRSGGAVQLSNGWVMGDWFARFIKGKDVFSAMTWKAMNRKMLPDQ